MKIRLLTLIFILLFSCNNRKFATPDSVEINKIIKVVFDSDTLNSEYYVYDRLLVNNLCIKNKDYRDTLIPQTPMALDYSDLLNKISLKNDFRQEDSLFITYQVDSMRSIKFDTSIFRTLKTSNYRQDYNCYELYLPIFSKNMRMAYFQYYINLNYCDSKIQKFILEKKNNTWEVIKKLEN